ncbi:hypothetical protein CY34DRAFT_809183 [Suillus luteus UH-Slu-Lm8-n1]|uniref:Uncharacterized protein n=1 Tax=Suillus luteus UH-Slu-Lm8-n1 TaxID=930992 RepID=A0A0D0AKF2_9AGAM|nr:hypothetical protein CY34DRAFT_809183 [Suillus luteus UH-Slu-Lm8-n1]
MWDPNRKTALHASLHRTENIDWWCNGDQATFLQLRAELSCSTSSLGKSRVFASRPE